MKGSQKIILSIMLLIVLATGFVVGILWNDFPNVSFKSEIRISEIASFLLTLSLGVMIPFVVKKLIDDKRSIKAFLVDDAKVILSKTDHIKTLIASSLHNRVMSKDIKQNINFTFHEMELATDSLESQLSKSFSSKKNIVRPFKTSYTEYKDFVTSERLMSNKFQIDESFYMEHANQCAKFTKSLKELVHDLHLL